MYNYAISPILMTSEERLIQQNFSLLIKKKHTVLEGVCAAGGQIEKKKKHPLRRHI